MSFRCGARWVRRKVTPEIGRIEEGNLVGVFMKPLCFMT